MANRLVRALGATSCLVEPFAGSAAVGIRALLGGSADRLVLAEKEPSLRALWEVVAVASDREFQGLLRILEAAEPSRQWWQAFEVRPAHEPHQVAARTLLASRFKWGGIPGGGLASDEELARHWRAGTMVARLEAIRAARGRMTVREDAFAAIAEHVHDARAAFFVDPPYSLPGGPASRLYRHYEVDHEELVSALGRVRGRVVLTYPDVPEARALAARHGFEVEPLAIRDGHRRQRTELLLARGTGPPPT